MTGTVVDLAVAVGSKVFAVGDGLEDPGSGVGVSASVLVASSGVIEAASSPLEVGSNVIGEKDSSFTASPTDVIGVFVGVKVAMD